MNTIQTDQIMAMIEMSYQSQLNKLDQLKFYNNLKLFLVDEDFELVQANLRNHIKSSSFIPTIADLVKQPKKDEQHRPYIPDVEETMKYIEEKREHEKNATSREKALKYLEEMRKVINADGH